MAGFNARGSVAEVETNSVDKLFESLKDINDTREKARKTQSEFTAKIDELNKDFATNPENNLFFGPDGIPTTPPPAIVAGKAAGLKAKMDFEAQMERQKALSTVSGQLDAINTYNKGLTDPNGGPSLNPDDPRLLRAYLGPNGVTPLTLGQAKADALNEVATRFPAINTYQKVGPVVESYFTNEPKYESKAVKQSDMLSTLKQLQSAKLAPEDIAGARSISDSFAALTNKLSTGGTLTDEEERDIRRKLVSNYDELGASFNNAIDAAPKLTKVTIGTKGITDIIAKHVPMASRGIPSYASVAEAQAAKPAVGSTIIIGGVKHTVGKK